MTANEQQLKDFNDWKRKVSKLTDAKFDGIDVDDLADMNFMEAFTNGVSPAEFVDTTVREQINEESGLLDSDEEEFEEQASEDEFENKARTIRRSL